MEDQNNDAPKRLIDSTPMTKEKQISLAEQLQAMTLRLLADRVENRTISDTGLATIIRLLVSQGWSLDPATVKQNLKDMLTTTVDPKELDEELDNVFPLRRNA